jgi:hypothetical protein
MWRRGLRLRALLICLLLPQVYQRRRLPRSRLPYYMTRVKRMEELE